MHNEEIKERIDNGLNKIQLTNKMKNNIRNQCKQEEKQYTSKVSYLFGKGRWHKRVVIGLGTVLLISGTLMAIDYVFGFDLFFNKEELAKIEEERTVIGQIDEKEGIKLIVEEAIEDQYGIGIVVSFINGTGVPWPEHIEYQTLAIDGAHSIRIKEGVLSEDGKRLTYFIQGLSSREREDSKIRLKAPGLSTIAYTEETIQLDIGKLYEKEGVLINIDDYNFEFYDDQYIALVEQILQGNPEYKETLGTKESSVTWLGVGYLEESSSNKNTKEAMDRTGLVLFTRNAEYTVDTQWWTDAYCAGGITELIDIRTGETYQATSQSRIQVGRENEIIQANHFPDIKKDQIPYLRASKVTYEKQDIISSASWEVQFNLEKNTRYKEIETDIEYVRENQKVTVDKVYLSTLGIQIEGTCLELETNKILGLPNEELQIKVKTRDGKEVSLLSAKGTIKEDEKGKRVGYIQTYEYVLDNRQRAFLEITEVDEIIINGQRIEIE